MQTKDAIKLALKSTNDFLNMYLSDLSDDDLKVRPAPTANNIAWQLGHLISSEHSMMEVMPGTKYPELPAGMKDGYTKKTASTSPPTGYLKKAEYLDLMNKMRAVTIAQVERMTDAEFDKPMSGQMAQWAPTLGALLMLTANHTMMHAGQFTVVRRMLNKPVLF
jgi:uncharacterized damage-inducible protein DinB